MAAVSAALCALPSSAWALGLGRLTVQSALGEALRAEIDITSLTPDEAANLRARVAPPESYRVAGIDYSPVLPATSVLLQRRPDGSAFLRISSDRPVQEPFVDVILEVNSSTGRLLREYTLLFDPPATASRAPASAPAPGALAIAPPAPVARPAPAPAPAPVAEAAPAPAAPPVASQPRVRPAPAPAAAAPAARAPAAAADGQQYKVRPGDTLSSIASRLQGSGVSLDQMLVGLYRGNEAAFMGKNMNRLRSGVVLNVPSADDLQGVETKEARQVVTAHSADFNAYRQRLAKAVQERPVAEEPARKSAGKVQAEVDDRKQAAAPSPDRLKIDKGVAASSSAPAVEDKVAKERAQKEAASRVQELNRNLEALKKLQAASATATPSAAAGKAASAAAPTLSVPASVPAPAPKVAAVASAPAAPAVARAASVPVAASAAVVAASAPAVVASAPVLADAASAAASAAAVEASAPVMAQASAPEVPASVAAAASVPVAKAPEPTGDDEPSFFSSLAENPLVLPVAGLALAALAGLGLYRLRGRGKEEAGVTSFLESRLQPDSFFGASGGQRIDTRDATGAPSSMSYSLSQIDAIGDVDPVAEADVYLAYGRDLQAEEILKEAMRANPDRLAIRTKLLEVYAKRRDTKGYELLAGELYGLTGGQGEDWARAQELGRSIDPDNPLYEPGGQPTAGLSPERGGELLGASTMPQSIVPSPSRYENSLPDVDASAASADVDLDISVPGEMDDATSTRGGFLNSGAGFDVPLGDSTRTAPDTGLGGLDFELNDVPAPAPARADARATAPGMDLGDISLDLDAPSFGVSVPGPDTGPQDGLNGLDMDDDDADPLARKLELAEEFNQIGDVEGARDLLNEVIENAEGALKIRAQAMRDTLG
ncbi:FimV/HubP family polar landmark protein [Sphaerotilus hippei]|uniref:FimV/HubP family polar landmark protein n=1 Tax=Sphaerotilus hippei TaxID=744406 RepID=UPI001FE97B50|nr:FimV/HubP family polar landmark protein [Sphaerotilus hippei]